MRVGQHKLLNKEVVQFKRFMCSREGFRSDKGEDPSNEKKKPKEKEPRCGCNAHIVVKWCSGNTYKVSSLIEHHNHGLVLPDKVTKSKRRVSEKAKNKLSVRISLCEYNGLTDVLLLTLLGYASWYLPVVAF